MVRNIRHRSHLRHNITCYTRVTETRVRFNLKEDTEGENKNKENQRVRKEEDQRSYTRLSQQMVVKQFLTQLLILKSEYLAEHVTKLSQLQMTFLSRVLSRRELLNSEIVLVQNRVWMKWGAQNQSWTIRYGSKMRQLKCMSILSKRMD